MFDVVIIDLVGLDFEATRSQVARFGAAQLQDMNPKGLLWVACDFDPQNLAASGPFVIADVVARQTGWKLLNIVVRPDFARSSRAFAFTDICEYLLLFVKEPDHRFNKDIVREDHIWQHAEWGKREKNYFPLGKDPGNVWIPTIDDGKGTVTGHAPMNLAETFARCILLSLPRKNEVQNGQEAMRVCICTRRPMATQEIEAILSKHSSMKRETFEKTKPILARDEARNALVAALQEITPLPLGEYAWFIQFDGRTFTCHRSLTGATVTSITTSPKLASLWAAATGDNEPIIPISKAFKLTTAENTAIKVRAAIEGAWFPNEWGVQIQSL